MIPKYRNLSHFLLAVALIHNMWSKIGKITHFQDIYVSKCYLELFKINIFSQQYNNKLSKSLNSKCSERKSIFSLAKLIVISV